MTASAWAVLLAVSVTGGGPDHGNEGAYSAIASGETGQYVTEGTNESAAYGDVACRDLMPQNGYSPRYGCYPGNARHIHRYPAFHGWVYRKPYNYRQMFDYPWHAGLHEPTSLFGYNVEEQTIRDEGTTEDDEAAAAKARALSGRYPPKKLSAIQIPSQAKTPGPSVKGAEQSQVQNAPKPVPSRTLYRRSPAAAVQQPRGVSRAKPSSVSENQTQVLSDRPAVATASDSTVRRIRESAKASSSSATTQNRAGKQVAKTGVKTASKRPLDSEDMRILMEEVERRVRKEEERDRADGAGLPTVDQKEQLPTQEVSQSKVIASPAQSALGNSEGVSPTTSADAANADVAKRASFYETGSNASSSQGVVIPVSGSRTETSRSPQATKVEVTESLPARPSASSSKLSWRAKSR